MTDDHCPGGSAPPTIVVPGRSLRGRFDLPKSKPHSQRALLLASLADGRSRLGQLDTCSETALIAHGCRELGAAMTEDGSTLVVDGVDGHPRAATTVLDTAGSGFAARALLAVSSLAGGPTIVDGSDQLAQRPISPLLDCLTELGGKFELLEGGRGLPVVNWSYGLTGGTVSVPAYETSQFATALMLVAPYAKRAVRLRLQGPVVGGHYLQMTAEMMRSLGAHVEVSDSLRSVEVTPGGYVAGPLSMGPDVTSFFYFAAAAVVVDTDVRLDGVQPGTDPFLDEAIGIARRMGVVVEPVEGGVRLCSGAAPAAPVVIDASSVPTLVPAIAAAASSLPAGMRLTGARHLRHHKTSRLGLAMERLGRLGRVLEPVIDGGVLDGFTTAAGGPPLEQVLDCGGDHRIFMALYIAAMGSRQETSIFGAETLTTSFARFLDCFGQPAPAGTAPAGPALVAKDR